MNPEDERISIENIINHYESEQEGRILNNISNV